jgi:hypothetical protein
MAITTALVMGALGTAASAAIGTAASMGAASLLGGGGGGGSAGGGPTTIGMPSQLQTGLFTPPTESDSGEEKSLATAGTFDPGSNPFELREKAMSWMTLGKEV